MLYRRQCHEVLEGKQHLKTAECCRFRDGIDTNKMKNRLPPMILAQPAGFQPHPSRLIFAIGKSYKNFLQSCEAFRKISEDLRGDFALIAARPQDARNQDPAWSFKAQWEVGPLSGSPSKARSRSSQSSRISSVNRLCSFIPHAPSSVRIALAVRPCRPITFPRSSGCTRNSSTVTCDPSTDFTCTSSGWSTRALAMASTSSFIRHLHASDFPLELGKCVPPSGAEEGRVKLASQEGN